MSSFGTNPGGWGGDELGGNPIDLNPPPPPPPALPTSGYIYLTFAAAKVELLNRLSDPGGVYWSDNPIVGISEIGAILIEAIRTYNALTGFHRARTTFPTVRGSAFYDLSTALQQPLRTYNVTDTDIVTAIQYHFLEPQGLPGGAWPGTDQFTLADVTATVERRRNQFLLETGTILSRFTQLVASAPIGRVSFPDSVAKIKRMSWMDARGNFSPLTPLDETSFMAFNQAWNLNPALVPREYSIASTPPLTLQLGPVPRNAGVLDITAILNGPTLNPAAGVLLKVPDDLAWVIKYGAMADLLGKQGQAQDPLRAGYCESRWREGLELGRLWADMPNSAWPAYVNDSQVTLTSLEDLDTFNPLWQNSFGTPTDVGYAGMNFCIVSPVPDSGKSAITLDLTQNAPIPAADGDFIQIPREHIDAVLDYAEHIAAFKQGAKETVDTVGHYERLKRVAALQNEKLRESTIIQDTPDELARAKQTPRKADQILAGG